MHRAPGTLYYGLMPCARLQLEHTALLVVDVQEKLKPHIHAAEQIVRQIGKLIDGAAALGIPTLVTAYSLMALSYTTPAP